MRAERPSKDITIERRFQLLVEAVTDYAICMLDANGRVINWNSGAERIAGYSRDEIIGEHFSRFYTDEDRSAGVPVRSLEVAADAGKFQGEGWRVRKDGARFWANVAINAIRDERGELLGFAQVTHDVSERREAQRKLDETREELFQAQKMEAIGQLTGGIAHDFNNLLTVIGVGAELAEPLVGDNEKLKRIVRNMRNAASRGESLTRQLLAFSRRQPMRPQVIDVARQLGAVCDLLARSLGGDVEIVRDFAPDLKPIAVDPRQFELAMLNVALNARDAMPNGGRIRLAARNVARDPESGARGEYVLVEVADNGVGMSPQVKARAFEPFFTTKEVGRGSGMGLSQAHRLAQQSGGSIAIESAPGEGAKISFYFPATSLPASATIALQPEQEAGLAQASETVGSPRGREQAAAAVTILVVEDDPSVAELVRDLLDGSGYDVRVASDALSALDMLRASDGVDLVFSDIMMPGEMNGLDLARAVREEFPGVFVLLATGYAAAASKAAAEFPLIGKPYGREQLLEQLDRILGEGR